ncbi:hypothetical protein [Lapidilactobacillus bayanensis]|uniref:hypothetical protein n=1 Tax=Lapidilactobacillus bayanensis TaxID=2485998 RepID=UPI000F7B9F98|nr:hypothetical protein [Lapidilactobacillus bayanensis]
MAAKEYLALERSGRCLKPIFCKIVSKTSLLVTAKAATRISLLSGILSPPLSQQEGNLCASTELTSG